MRTSRIGTVIAGTCLAVGLAACGGSDDSGSDNGSGTPTPEAGPTESTPEASGDGQVGGSETGFVINVTDDWLEVDVETGEILAEAESAGLLDDPELVQRIAQQLDGVPGVVFAFELGPDHSEDAEFVTNLNGYCVPYGGEPDFAAMALSTESELGSIGATSIEMSETTAGSVPALRTTYLLSTVDMDLAGLQYAFFGAANEACFLTFTTPAEDQNPDRFDQIANTLQLA